jgi:RNA polymerase I-associated factor PAF67
LRALLFSFYHLLADIYASEIVGEYGVRPLYRMLGYFSVIGLLRVHVLLGDFTLALKVLDHIELNQKVIDIRAVSTF